VYELVGWNSVHLKEFSRYQGNRSSRDGEHSSGFRKRKNIYLTVCVRFGYLFLGGAGDIRALAGS
jgi:hypothetical protein